MIDYRIMPDKKLVVICNWGKTTMDETMALRRKLRNDPGFSHNFDVILDNTHFEFQYSSAEIQTFAKERLKRETSTVKFAVIAPADVSFGMNRMYGMLSQDETPDEKRLFMVFRDIDSATQWIGCQPDDIKEILNEIMEEIAQ